MVVTDRNIQIKDSYKITVTAEMEDVLNTLRFQYPDNAVLMTRSNTGLIREWKGHNLLYQMGILRSHTKDVDLDYNTNVFYTVGYWILSVGFDIYNFFA